MFRMILLEGMEGIKNRDLVIVFNEYENYNYKYNYNIERKTWHALWCDESLKKAANRFLSLGIHDV